MELICIFPFACALYIWHDTDTFVEYMSLFGLGNFFGIQRGTRAQSDDGL